MVSLCAGSLIAFSFYAHVFLSRLFYTQYQVNAVAIAGELSMYLLVPIFGYLCDRYSPRPVQFLSGLFFGAGYGLAGLTYRQGPPSQGGWSVGIMILSFIGIGTGTCSMYISAVSACAKNFGKSRYKGLALALPSAAFGLSGMWQSQIGSLWLSEPHADGSRGDVDVFRYFLFLSGISFVAGLIGSFALKVVNEEELIGEAIEELERSGFLEDSPLFHQPIPHGSNGYGTYGDGQNQPPLNLAPADQEAHNKSWLLNVETQRFLADHTMWLFAAAFLFVAGPGEAFINNFGTVIGSIYHPPVSPPPSNSMVANISIYSIFSTLARILTGILSDLLTPSYSSVTSHRRDSQSSDLNSILQPNYLVKPPFSLSRVTILIFCHFPLIIGFCLLASPLLTAHPDLFPVISALVGTGYGAASTLAPIIVSVVWGVQNFGTNWGIITTVPALGAAVWGAAYSFVYQYYAEDSGLCYGRICFAGTFWAMGASGLLSLVLLCWVWRGKSGWIKRGVFV